jgi:hypothetical protein
MTLSTPNGPVEIRTEHDAVIAIESVGPDSLHAWYDELAIATISPVAELRPDASSVLGQQFVLRADGNGHLDALATPVFPESFKDVSDLTAQFFDFFPSRPNGGYSMGASWTDTISGPEATDPGTEMDMSKITRYSIGSEDEVDGVEVFVIRAEATLDFAVEGPVPNQPGLRVLNVMTGPETNVFRVAKQDGRLIDRSRSARLSGTMEYIGTPQPVVLPVTRQYTNSIELVGGGGR